MNIQTKVIKILLEDGDGCSGDGTTGSGDNNYSVPGIFNYSTFKRKRKSKKKKHKKHHESVSATGGNDGALTGGDVYSIGVNMGTKPTPRSTGDLVLSPVSTEPNNSSGAYGIPTKSLKNRKRKSVTIKQKDGKKLRVLNYDGYIKSKINNVTHLKK